MSTSMMAGDGLNSSSTGIVAAAGAAAGTTALAGGGVPAAAGGAAAAGAAAGGAEAAGAAAASGAPAPGSGCLMFEQRWCSHAMMSAASSTASRRFSTEQLGESPIRLRELTICGTNCAELE